MGDAQIITDMVKASRKPDTAPAGYPEPPHLKKAYIGVKRPDPEPLKELFGVICLNFGITERMTYGMQKVTWDRSTVPQFSDMPKTRRSSSGKYLMISALSSGYCSVPIITVSDLFFMDIMPIQARVPMTVATAAAAKSDGESIPDRFHDHGIPSISLKNSLQREKSDHTDIDLLSLKENTITGGY